MASDIEPVVAAQLLALLRCPLTGQALVIAPGDLISRLEAERLAGTLRDHSGNPIKEMITAGLLCEHGSRVFLIRDKIPVLLADDSIPIN